MMELLNEFLSGSVAWGVLLTLAAFALGALVNRVTGKAFFNPLLLGAIFVIVFLSVCGIPYADYKVSAAPVAEAVIAAPVATVDEEFAHAAPVPMACSIDNPDCEACQ